MSKYILKIEDWERDGERYVFPNSGKESGWGNKGLVPVNRYSADLFNWYGFEFDCEIDGETEIVIKAELLDFQEVNADENSDFFTWRARVCGKGKIHVSAPLEQFDLISVMSARWRFLRSVELNVKAERLVALKSKGLGIDAAVRSESAQANEEICYPLKLYNCKNEKLAVSFCFERDGREVMQPVIEPESVVLEPYSEYECVLKAKMSERIAKGGYELHRLKAIPNADGAAAQALDFYSVRALDHPYITHTESGWNEVKDKINRYDWARELYDSYMARANEWEVPMIGMHNGGLFVTKNSEHCYCAAFCYKLSGEIGLAKKAALFLKCLSNRENGYPMRMKACSQQLVHEGEFFKYCARAYDLIFDAGVLSESEKADIEYTFRIFMNHLDWALSDGGISNWSLAESAGALYCAMALQDRAMIERFTFGKGAVIEHLKAGVMSDGWWCECTIGYNQMVAGLFSEIALALRPWGINIAELWVGANYCEKVHSKSKHVDGLSWNIYGENERNYRCIEDLWKSLVIMANYKSVVQGVNDSAEERFEGASPASYDSRYDIAYRLYKKPEYAKIIINGGGLRDLFYGEGELPDEENDYCMRSHCFDNGGIALLRTRVKGRVPAEQIEASLKYGSHGGAHGHYDRCALNALSRNGRSLFNPENVWYSYGTYMYKFFVQTSIAHNMVTVDLKMQDPSEAKRTLFYNGEIFSAVTIENHAKWSNPPYGGWRVMNGEKDFAQRSWVEGRYIHIPENAPEYASRTEFTEPVTQRRTLVLTEDYALCFDYMEGEEVHDYDCIYHLKGLRSISGARVKDGKPTRLSDNPLSSAQFISEVERYDTDDTVKLSFAYEYTDKESAKAPWIGRHPFRSGHNSIGTEYADLYYVSDKSELTVGCDPEYYPVSKRLFYTVKADGEILAQGKFGAWIFGKEHIDADIRGKKKLRLEIRTEDGQVDHALVQETYKTIFWGDPYFITEDGAKTYMSDLSYSSENTDYGFGIGKDYAGGAVKIEGELYERAVPADGIDRTKPAAIEVDLSGLNAVRFVSDIGGDYPVGDESKRRRCVALRKSGKKASFISLIEIYDDKPIIKGIRGAGSGAIYVSLEDGREQLIRVFNMNSGKNISIIFEEFKHGFKLREEKYIK